MKPISMNYTESFLRFYKIYPKKKGKWEAFKKWQSWKLHKIEQEIVDRVKHLIKYDWKDPKFIPYCSSFINQRIWEDEVRAEQPKRDYIPLPRKPIDSPLVWEKRVAYRKVLADYKMANSPHEIDRATHKEREIKAKKELDMAIKDSSTVKLGDLIKKGVGR